MKHCRNQRGTREVAISAQLCELYTVSLLRPTLIESKGRTIEAVSVIGGISVVVA